MSFDVTADAYGQFMGRFSEPLATEFAQRVDAHPGQRALDVGCGPGALTAQLVARLGAGAVAAIDPSPPFVAATRHRFPGVDVRTAVAEQLPFDDDEFDLTLAQLVVHFMSDPVAALSEMARVTRAGGLVAASVWDHAGGGGPLTEFWRAVHDVDADAPGEAELAGAREGHLAELCRAAGLGQAQEGSVAVAVRFSSFDEWWEPFSLGVGPAGAYVARLDHHHRQVLRDQCARRLPKAPFEIVASAWCVTATV